MTAELIALAAHLRSLSIRAATAAPSYSSETCVPNGVVGLTVIALVAQRKRAVQ